MCNYVYQYKDHLGNVRLSYADSDGDGMVDVVRNNVDIDGDGDLSNEIREENNYYPFGLKHKGYNNEIAIGTRDHKYGFGGKEEQLELGLEWMDFHARNYDASLGRWMNVDPLAEKYYSESTYTYTMNNPVYFIDPDGMRVDVTDLVNDNEDDAWTLFNMMIDLSAISGMTIGLNADDEGNYSLSTTDCANECSEASMYVSHLINSDSTIKVFGSQGDHEDSQTNGGPSGVNINSDQINGIQESLLGAELDPKAMSVGMAFLHETLHTITGANFFTSVEDHNEKNNEAFSDGPTPNSPITGPVVKRINSFRSRMGLPERTTYNRTTGSMEWKINEKTTTIHPKNKPLTKKQKKNVSQKLSKYF